MIGKQNIGRGFRGTLGYVLGKEGAELIGGNMLGENAQELAAEFSESRKLKPNLGRAVYHTSLSAAPNEHLSDQKWNQVAGKYLDEMGFQGCQYVVVRHKDTELDHIHIVASRVHMEGPEKGKVVSDSKNYERSETVLRGIEKEHGLKPVAMSRDVDKRAPTRGEMELGKRGEPSIKLRLQDRLDEILKSQPKTMTDFFQKCEEKRIAAIPNVAKTGHVSGISFVLDSEQMKGSDLGKKYTWGGLQKQGVTYDHDRDGQTIGKAKERGERFNRSKDRTNGERGVSTKGIDGSQPSDSTAVGGSSHSKQGMPGEHGGIRTHDQAVSGGLRGSDRAGEASRSGASREIQPNHAQTLGRDGAHKPPNRSAEYLRVLKNAAESLRRQGVSQSLSGSSKSISAAQSREAEKGRSTPIFKSKALERLEEEIAQIEREEEKRKRHEQELERQRKLAREKGRDGPDRGGGISL